MHLYRLENVVQDKLFLSGEPVTCRAVLKKGAEILAKGDHIIVELSNRKKYKGKVVDFHSFKVGDVEAGDLLLVKS